MAATRTRVNARKVKTSNDVADALESVADQPGDERWRPRHNEHLVKAPPGFHIRRCLRASVLFGGRSAAVRCRHRQCSVIAGWCAAPVG